MTNFATPGIGTSTATWEYMGYSGAGNVEGLLGSHAGRAALIGGNAEGVFDEWRRCEQKYPTAVRIGVNDAGMYLPNLDHWVTEHYRNVAAWKAVRWLHPMGVKRTMVHSCDEASGVDFVWEQLNPLFALSGNFAMQIAFLLGCAPIILCGCPGSPARRFFDLEPREMGYEGLRQQVVSEMTRLPEFKAVVRSCSGWSMQFFGSPEEETWTITPILPLLPILQPNPPGRKCGPL